MLHPRSAADSAAALAELVTRLEHELLPVSSAVPGEPPPAAASCQTLQSILRLLDCAIDTGDAGRWATGGDEHDNDDDNQLTALAEMSRQLLADRGLSPSLADVVCARLLAEGGGGGGGDLHARWLRLMSAEAEAALRRPPTPLTPMPKTPLKSSASSSRPAAAAAPTAVADAVARCLRDSAALPAFLSSSSSGDAAVAGDWDDDATDAVAAGCLAVSLPTGQVVATFSPGDPFTAVVVGPGGVAEDAARLRERAEAAARADAFAEEVVALRAAFPIDWDREAGRLRFIAGRLGVLVELDVGSERAIRVLSVQPGGRLPPGCILPPPEAPLAKWLQCLECEFQDPPTPPPPTA